ncbi:coiled-coil alpha-helical rod protein 1-like isoform X3 [Dreissena polymorpha]|uniref:coiled-coil alpha-helical rod protein 1-like isoform X3 n=1 Tax=Dreissena polymorpha TaxID=45954 RepID=UPI002263F833|nr:coiled-coil alpha-helical rod protein 1-like isoform X3 [Dreissena polymorpha]
MAENLSIPSEFEKPKPKVMNMNLLPPSAFERKTSSADPWKEIAKATEEMAKLKIENSKLKEAQVIKETPATPTPHAQQETVQRPPPDVCKYQSKMKDDYKYVDELINKQACEIAELKNELRSLRCQHREEIPDLERQMTVKDRESAHRLASLEVELKSAEDRYQCQVEKLSREHEREEDELQGIVSRLRDELETSSLKSRDRVSELGTRYEQLKESSEQQIGELTEDLKFKLGLIEELQAQLLKLKKYIGDTENLPKPSEIVRKEKESLASKVKSYEEEVDHLKSTASLLNIRLNSLNEILRLQEQDIAKCPSEIEKSKMEGLLLTRWREKVFALMVQQKSADICTKKDTSNWMAKVQGLEEKLASAHNQVDQLTHTLSDREAQLGMERKNSQRLETEVSEAQQLALSLDDRIQENVCSAERLKQFTASVGQKVQENLEALTAALACLKGYGQRISFASGRVEMLQGLFARREALLKMQADGANIPEKDVPSVRTGATPEDSHEVGLLREELGRVTRERDRLAAQIKQDSTTWDSKVAAIRSEVAEELQTVSLANQDLESLVKEKSEKLSELVEELECCHADLEFANQNIEELKETLARQETHLQQVLEAQREEVENQSADRLADLDRQLNDAKREHTKAVVSLRQLERNSAREKSRLTEQLTTTEQHYTRQLEGLQQQLRAVEAERNLMMATLRQEGLVGRLKSERSEPVLPDWEIIEPAHLHLETSQDADQPAFGDSGLVQDPAEPVFVERATDLNPTNDGTDSPEGLTRENLSSVLEDLKSLTDAVLDDDDDDTGSDIES